MIPDDVGAPASSFPDDVGQRDLTHLGEMGGGFAGLSETIIETLSAHSDAPEFELEEYFISDRADLLCPSCACQLLIFSTCVSYPAYIEEIYAEGRMALARRTA